jgi:hypothetical protein
MLKMFTDKDFRDEFTSRAFETIQKQQEFLQKSAGENIKRVEAWAQEFYGATKDFNRENLSRISELEKLLTQGRRGKDRLVELNHQKDLALTTNRHTIETCSREYSNLYDQYLSFYKNVKGVQQQLKIQNPETPQLPETPSGISEKPRTFEYTNPKEVSNDFDFEGGKTDSGTKKSYRK